MITIRYRDIAVVIVTLSICALLSLFHAFLCVGIMHIVVPLARGMYRMVGFRVGPAVAETIDCRSSSVALQLTS